MTGYKEAAEKLWQIIDNIDTASDIAKGDDRLYRKLVSSETKKRFKIAQTDGYRIYFDKEEYAANRKR